MSIALIIFGVILLLITYYIIVYVIYKGSGNNDILTTMTPLSSKKDIFTSDVTQTTLLSGAGSTVMAYFNFRRGNIESCSEIHSFLLFFCICFSIQLIIYEKTSSLNGSL